MARWPALRTSILAAAARSKTPTMTATMMTVCFFCAADCGADGCGCGFWVSDIDEWLAGDVQERQRRVGSHVLRQDAVPLFDGLELDVVAAALLGDGLGLNLDGLGFGFGLGDALFGLE